MLVNLQIEDPSLFTIILVFFNLRHITNFQEFHVLFESLPYRHTDYRQTESFIPMIALIIVYFLGISQKNQATYF